MYYGHGVLWSEILLFIEVLDVSPFHSFLSIQPFRSSAIDLSENSKAQGPICVAGMKGQIVL